MSVLLAGIRNLSIKKKARYWNSRYNLKQKNSFPVLRPFIKEYLYRKYISGRDSEIT